MNKATRKRCAEFCGGKIQGIVDNLKLRGRISPDFEAEIKPLNSFALIPPDSYVLSCPLHHRKFLVRRK